MTIWCTFLSACLATGETLEILSLWIIVDEILRRSLRVQVNVIVKILDIRLNAFLRLDFTFIRMTEIFFRSY